ncbi:MAG TPA: o-succinylbenzoate--CoA ligase [Bacillota bacterium]|nr:o-succinylbenzoate--CoA ligase [Bacillota bacterium]
MNTVMPHWLTKRAYLSPEQVAIETHEGEVLTFLQLQEKSKSFARKLASVGVRSGENVGIFSGNEPQMIIAIHALSYLGCTCVLLNMRLTETELSYQIKDSNMSYLLASDSEYKKVTEMNVPVEVLSFSMIKTKQEKEVSLVTEISLDDPFTIVYTSGTTGNPKGVVHTYGNHWWSAISSALNLGLSQNDKWLTVLPMFHVGGFSICMRSIIYGISMYVMEKFDVAEVNEAIFSKNITIASVVTVMLQQLTDNLQDQAYPETFRCMLLGGGPVPKPLLETCAERNIPVFQSYGLTETSSQIVTLSPRDALKKLGSAGKPLFPGQLKIHQPDEDGVGEILVKGPMVTKGYLHNEQANTESFQNGWLATGDLGYVDEEGFLYVVERRTDLIISGGENVYPSEIESVLSGCVHVKDIGVIGKKDDKWGEIPVAFIVPSTKNVLKEEILKYAEKHLARYKVPKEIKFVQELPRTASNKLMRRELVKMLS